jgi:hypothetical protein
VDGTHDGIGGRRLRRNQIIPPADLGPSDANIGGVVDARLQSGLPNLKGIHLHEFLFPSISFLCNSSAGGHGGVVRRRD